MENNTIAKLAGVEQSWIVSNFVFKFFFLHYTNLPNCFHFFTSSHKLNKLLHSHIEFKVTLDRNHGMKSLSYIEKVALFIWLGLTPGMLHIGFRKSVSVQTVQHVDTCTT